MTDAVTMRLNQQDRLAFRTAIEILLDPLFAEDSMTLKGDFQNLVALNIIANEAVNQALAI